MLLSSWNSSLCKQNSHHQDWWRENVEHMKMLKFFIIIIGAKESEWQSDKHGMNAEMHMSEREGWCMRRKEASEILIIWKDEVEPGKKWKCVKQVINCVRLSERATTTMMSIYWFFTFHFSSSLGTAAALDIIGKKRKSGKLKFFHSFKVLFVCAILVYHRIEWKLWNNLDKLLFSSSSSRRLGDLKSLRNSKKSAEWSAESGADVNDGTKTKKNEDSDERKRGKNISNIYVIFD